MSWPNRLLLFEAAATLALVSVAIRLLPFRRVISAARQYNRPMVCDVVQRAYEVRRVRWAVEACADRAPWRAMCFQRGLAVHFILRRRGIASVLHYGVAKSEDGLRAHVWVSESGKAVIGGEEARQFACVASFPSTEQY
jgi:hypothetical protein